MEERKFIDDKHFVQTETFDGEELEAIYLVARKPMDNIEGVDLSASDDPMLVSTERRRS